MFGLVAAASAQTANTTFQVTANVANACSVVATDLAFGAYDPFSATPKDGSSTITVTCTNGASYAVAIQGGPTGRSMTRTGGGATMTYGLFSDTGRTTGFSLAAQPGTGAAVAHNVYGRIPSGQTSVLAGNYAETVTVNVTY